jgi:hypothetical protein
MEIKYYVIPDSSLSTIVFRVDRLYILFKRSGGNEYITASWCPSACITCETADNIPFKRNTDSAGFQEVPLEASKKIRNTIQRFH